jgi:hypothetical protein
MVRSIATVVILHVSSLTIAAVAAGIGTEQGRCGNRATGPTSTTVVPPSLGSLAQAKLQGKTAGWYCMSAPGRPRHTLLACSAWQAVVTASSANELVRLAASQEGQAERY